MLSGVFGLAKRSDKSSAKVRIPSVPDAYVYEVDGVMISMPGIGATRMQQRVSDNYDTGCKQNYRHEILLERPWKTIGNCCIVEQ